MTKRANPFAEDYVPQSKVHIGVKQFNNNEDRLTKVYAKTLELLFMGAKKITMPITLNNINSNTNKKGEKMRQLFIGKNGSLLHSDNVLQQTTSLKQCSCENSIESKCSYCDAALCSACQHDCERCLQAYCGNCIIGVDGPEVCMSCYG